MWHPKRHLDTLRVCLPQDGPGLCSARTRPNNRPFLNLWWDKWRLSLFSYLSLSLTHIHTASHSFQTLWSGKWYCVLSKHLLMYAIWWCYYNNNMFYIAYTYSLTIYWIAWLISTVFFSFWKQEVVMCEGVKDQKTEGMSIRSLEKSQHVERSAPDGGWGWMIVAGCFFTTVCTRGVTRFVRDFQNTALSLLTCYGISLHNHYQIIVRLSGNENCDVLILMYWMGKYFMYLFFYQDRICTCKIQFLKKSFCSMLKAVFKRKKARTWSQICAFSCGLQVCFHSLCGIPDIFFQRLFCNRVDPLSVGLHYYVVW